MVSIAICLYMSKDDSLLERSTRSSVFRIAMVGVGVLLFVLGSTSILALHVGRQHASCNT
jgi:hypothetical protein